MHLDVSDLKGFYDLQVGQVARQLIRKRIHELWPSVRGQVVLGLGYATPYLRPLQGEAERVLAMMPAQQGVIAWPQEAGSLTALVEETDLPLPDASIDRVILVHMLETSESLRPLLRQVWRVLAGNGRLIVIAPNRASLWAQFETTPFGHGTPFSRAQLHRLLTDSMFTPLSFKNCLYFPPFGTRTLLRDGLRWEAIGSRIWPRFSGVVLAEATKQVYALAPDGGARRRVRAKPVLIPSGAVSSRETEEKSRPQP
jgi:SAM-dependent methyltransferase